MEKILHVVKPEHLPAGSGWSHITCGSGAVAFVSGQISVDEANNVVGKGDLERQIRQVYENLERCFAAVGASWSNVLKINYYATNIRDALPLMRKIREEVMPAEGRPANTFVEVSALATPDFLFEAEATLLL